MSKVGFFVLLAFVPTLALCQSVAVRGTVYSEWDGIRTPVRYARVVFVDQSDTSKKFSTFTDTLGNYRLDVLTSVTGEEVRVPVRIELLQNYPNPFLGTTAISYRLNKESEVSLRIYNIIGQEIRSWTLGIQGAGTYGFVWDGRDEFGSKVSPGIYFYQVRAGGEMHVKKMVFGLGGSGVGADESRVSFSGRKNSQESNLALKSIARTSVGGNTFSIQISNTECTRPRIVEQTFASVRITTDTTFDFPVAPTAVQPFPPLYPPTHGTPVWHPSGRIAFNWTKILRINRCTGGVRQEDIDRDSSGFWMINPDGSGLQKLLPYHLDDPAWSKDGQWIAYGSVQLYKMRFTGSGFDTSRIIQLTFEGRNFFPAWSPDGLWIAYSNSVGEPIGVWMSPTDGSGLRFYFTFGAQPDWFLDGQRLLYGNRGLWIERLDHSSRIQIYVDTINTLGASRVSSDGTKIAFISQAPGNVSQLWVMNADGSNSRQLTTEGAVNFSWSPDGTQIVYVQHDYRKADIHNGTLWIMNADGSNKRQLTFNHGLTFYPF
ncbi:MAG TPA: FlgD immunoglobulin-like domain containing protein [Bacteroidota bacterium]|nr:FlgD immunoglobulin-like domain containing protein [Bacteroidota bacterium]